MSEFEAWRVYHQFDPFGPMRGDLRAAIIAAVIANVNRSKNSRPIPVSEFMPDFTGDIERARREAEAEKLRAWFDRKHEKQLEEKDE